MRYDGLVMWGFEHRLLCHLFNIIFHIPIQTTSTNAIILSASWFRYNCLPRESIECNPRKAPSK